MTRALPLPRLSGAAVLLLLLAGTAHAATYRFGAATASLDPGAPLSALAVRCGGVEFRPFAGAGALGAGGVLTATAPVETTCAVRGETLVISLRSAAPGLRGFDPGQVQGLGEWRRLDLSQHALAYGQMNWQKTTYSVRGGFWFTAHWSMADGNGTAWEAPQTANEGNGPFPAALRVVYSPDNSGTLLPLRETLELRCSRELWAAVPALPQQPSEYRRDLAESVQLDLWGGESQGELRHLLEVLRLVGRGRLRYLTILQNWQVGGFDSLLPDSVWMPDYPPNPGVGTVAELRQLCDLGKQMGRFGFRTNYRLLREGSPSYRRGVAHYALGPDGKPLDYLRSADWPAVAGRQEEEIQRLFGANASFSDQLTSGAAPWSWHDYGPGGSTSMGETLRRERALATLIRAAHRGPLGSETLIDQQLLGQWIDTGDFGVMDGHHRLVSPEYKLRRLQALSAFHGSGLMYRFYEMPPFKQFHSGTTTFGNDPAQLDDYRACEVLFGNGAYVCYPFANWHYWLVECLLVGHLQRHYALQPVRAVRYWQAGAWRTLEELVRAGVVPNPDPWHGAPTEAFGRIRVEYGNGLTVVVNRLAGDFPVAEAVPPVVLPRSGWVAWKADGSVSAFSAPWPGTTHRVDYLLDRSATVRFLDPRGATVEGVDELTVWEAGRRVLSADPEGNRLWVAGQRLPLDLPAAPPLTALNFDFRESLQGWRLAAGVLTAAPGPEGLRLHTVSPDPQLVSPELRLAAADVPSLELKLKASAGTLAQLYFVTEAAPNTDENKVFRLEVVPDNQWHVYRIDAAGHALWRGQTITRLRFDPIHGPDEADVTVGYLRGARQ